MKQFILIISLMILNSDSAFARCAYRVLNDHNHPVEEQSFTTIESDGSTSAETRWYSLTIMTGVTRDDGVPLHRKLRVKYLETKNGKQTYAPESKFYSNLQNAFSKYQLLLSIGITDDEACKKIEATTYMNNSEIEITLDDVDVIWSK